MPYFSDLNTYLHQSSLLIQAYPSTRITTKYSLPRKPNSKAKSKSKDTSGSATESATDATTTAQPKRDRSATLTLKTFHPQSGICLKYRTDKAAEVGRLLNGLGRLAKGEVIEVASNSANAAVTEAEAEKMDVDGGGAAVMKTEEKIVSATPVAMQNAAAGSGGAGGGGKGKKKKGKK